MSAKASGSISARVFAADGSEKGTTALPEELFAQPVHEHLLWLSVKRHLGNQRQGNAKVKSRGEVSGGGKKPFRQKGTGRARQGSNTSPLMPGGGRAFGPRPRDYRTDLPKRQRRAALAAALSLKAGENAVSVLDRLAFEAPKTKAMQEVLKALGLADKRTLLVIDQADPNVVKSCRNLRNLRTTLAHQLNAYELMDCEAVLLTADGLKRVKEVFVR
jgi:large subunit ribosomal protein L4